MFTGVVVENFSYVFQASGSGSNSISREQMRSFKKIWAEFANRKTGYLERGQFAKFFSVRPVGSWVLARVDFPISEIERCFRSQNLSSGIQHQQYPQHL